MKIPTFFCLCLLAACGKPPPTPPAQVFQEDQSAGARTPVQTIPFEVGYKAGFAAATADVEPKAKMPDAATVAEKADQAAAGDPDRNEKWRHGFIEGYTDGFRKIALKQK